MALGIFADITFITILPTYLRKLEIDKTDIAHILSLSASTDLCSRIAVTSVSSCTTIIQGRKLFWGGLVGSIGAQLGELIII